MSNPIHLDRARRGGIALAAGLALVAVPSAAQASPVNLGTAAPFVVLGGSTVTNTGPSVLNGDLGVSPGTSLVGFGLPAVVNGTTHADDAVAGQAQADLTTAYDVAAGQPVAPADDLTGTDLGNRTLTAGAYRYGSSAQLTGPLTLDAEGDPDAQFVFEIGSTLTTASASSVRLVNGASPCNVYWQVGSSATLDSTTAFQGNLMALTDISLNNGASVIGRVLARNGQISLINNVLDSAPCATGSTTPPGGSGDSGGSSTGATPTPGGSGDTPAGPAASQSGALPADAGSAGGPPQAGASGDSGGSGDAVGAVGAVARIAQHANGTATEPGPAPGTAIMLRAPRRTCTAGFRAAVSGRLIKRVVFRLDGRRIASQVKSPFAVLVRAAPGQHRVTARVTFKDATRAKTMKLGYRACAAAILNPRPGPSRFAG